LNVHAHSEEKIEDSKDFKKISFQGLFPNDTFCLACPMRPVWLG